MLSRQTHVGYSMTRIEMEEIFAGFQVLNLMQWLVRTYYKAIFRHCIVGGETKRQLRIEKGIVKVCAFPESVF